MLAAVFVVAPSLGVIKNSTSVGDFMVAHLRPTHMGRAHFIGVCSGQNILIQALVVLLLFHGAAQSSRKRNHLCSIASNSIDFNPRPKKLPGARLADTRSVATFFS